MMWKSLKREIANLIIKIKTLTLRKQLSSQPSLQVPGPQIERVLAPPGYRFIIVWRTRGTKIMETYFLSYAPALPQPLPQTEFLEFSGPAGFVWVKKFSLRCEFITELDALTFVKQLSRPLQRQISIVQFLPCKN